VDQIRIGPDEEGVHGDITAIWYVYLISMREVVSRGTVKGDKLVT
jgi:hypothetical protein